MEGIHYLKGKREVANQQLQETLWDSGQDLMRTVFLSLKGDSLKEILCS